LCQCLPACPLTFQLERLFCDVGHESSFLKKSTIFWPRTNAGVRAVLPADEHSRMKHDVNEKAGLPFGEARAPQRLGPDRHTSRQKLVCETRVETTTTAPGPAADPADGTVGPESHLSFAAAYAPR
jgi:hypothetical protein